MFVGDDRCISPGVQRFGTLRMLSAARRCRGYGSGRLAALSPVRRYVLQLAPARGGRRGSGLAQIDSACPATPESVRLCAPLLEAERLDDGDALGDPPRVVGRAHCDDDAEARRDGDEAPRDRVAEREV